jgi:hemerythrin-like domain-containing protein
MAKVLIQEGIKKHLEKEGKSLFSENNSNTEKFRDELEKQGVKRLKRAPQRIRYYKKSD